MNVLYVIDADGLDVDCFDRFNTCLESLSRQTIATKITACIADYSTYSVKSRLSIPDNLKLNYFHQPLLEPFNKPFCINYAFKRFNFNVNDHFFFSDIDLIYPTNFIEYFNHKYSHIRDVCVTAMTFYQQHKDKEYIADYDKARDTIYLDRRYRGGALLISSQLFSVLRGYDERYFGWGKEDDDFIMRCGDRGIFIVDESVEFVHLYHPDKGTTPTINTELFLSRRRKPEEWYTSRPWGDWQQRPTHKEQYDWQLVAAYPCRSPQVIVTKSDESMSISSMDYPEPMKLDVLSELLWNLCDGNNRFPQIVEQLRNQCDLATNILEHKARLALNQLFARKHLSFSADPQTRPLLRIQFETNQFNEHIRHNVISSMQLHADIIEVFENSETAADIRIVSNIKMNSCHEITNTATLNVLWADTDPNILEQPDVDLLITSKIVLPHQRQSSFRVPAWLRLFNWYSENGAGLDTRLLTDQDADTDRPRHNFAVTCGLSNPLANEAFNQLSQYGNVVEMPSQSASLLDRYAAYFDSVFVIIDEQFCSAGSVCDDFVLALVAGAIPVYRGDPLLYMDFNPLRWISFNSRTELIDHAEIRSVFDSKEHYERILAEPLFNKIMMPYRLKYDALGEKLFTACRDKYILAFLENSNSRPSKFTAETPPLQTH